MAGDFQYADFSAFLKEQSYRLIKSCNKIRFIQYLLWAAVEMLSEEDCGRRITVY